MRHSTLDSRPLSSSSRCKRTRPSRVLVLPPMHQPRSPHCARLECASRMGPSRLRVVGWPGCRPSAVSGYVAQVPLGKPRPSPGSKGDSNPTQAVFKGFETQSHRFFKGLKSRLTSLKPKPAIFQRVRKLAVPKRPGISRSGPCLGGLGATWQVLCAALPVHYIAARLPVLIRGPTRNPFSPQFSNLWRPSRCGIQFGAGLRTCA